MMRFHRDRLGRARIPYDEVRIGARRIAPLRGYRLKFAALVEVTRTNSFGVSRPVFTPSSHSTDMRSSTPPQPFGILREVALAHRLLLAQNTQWSVAVV